MSLQQDIVSILRDFAEGMPPVSPQSGICYNLTAKLKTLYHTEDLAYELVEKLAGGTYMPFIDLDRETGGLSWRGDSGLLRRMFCGMSATRIERDGLDAVMATFPEGDSLGDPDEYTDD